MRGNVDKDLADLGIKLNSGIACRAFIDGADTSKSVLKKADMMKVFARFQALMQQKKEGKLTAPIVTPSKENTDIPSSVSLKTFDDSMSYFVGGSMRGNVDRDLKQIGVKINDDIACRGFMDGIDTAKVVLKKDAVKKVMDGYQSRMTKKQEEAGKGNKEAGDKYLAENKTKEGVKTTASGLQYKVIKSGTGASPKGDDMVKVDYKGTLIGGKVFDSSYDRGQPAEFGVKQVIPGWTEALQMMKVGDKWELAIPSDLAYGMQAPPEIGPNQALLFEVELLGITKDGAKKPASPEGGQQITPEQMEQIKKQMQQQGGKQ
jgi:FKBP-type peptidyl-prolyl cis-trans isomerase